MVISKNHFSERPASYAAYRPRYPDELFALIARHAPRRSVALDCGTGNGQAAVGLARHFDRVIATDGSPEQLRHAIAAPNVEYIQASAESSGLPPASVDAVTAAQALHWFDVDAFFREARRVLGRNGVIAIFGYGDPIMHGAELHRIVHELNRGTLEPYWPPEREILLEGYATIDFPFAEIEAPRLELKVSWNLSQLVGYLGTWSATARYIARTGRDPVATIREDLAIAWGDPQDLRIVRWPLCLRIGRVSG